MVFIMEKEIKVFEVRTPSPEKKLLLETLFQEEAERFTKTWYSGTGTICDIFEFNRVPVDHRG